MTLQTFDNNALMAELKSQRQGLIQAKSSLEAQLADINAKCARRLPQHEFHAVQKERSLLVREMGNIQARFSALNYDIQKLAMKDTEDWRNKKAETAKAVPSDVVRQLSELRQHYQDFAADHTHVSSMRTMAAQFVVKLNKIILEAVNP